MKNNQLDKFESLIKGKLDEHQVSYSPSDWNKLSSQLDKGTKPFYYSGWFVAAALVLLVSSVIVLTNELSVPTDKTDSLTVNQPEILDLVKTNHSTIDSNSKLEENSVVKNEYINAEKEINKLEKEKTQSNNEIKVENANSETNLSEKIEDKSEILDTDENTVESGFTPLNSDKNENNIVEEEVEISISKAEFHMNTFDCCEGSKVDFVSEKQNDVDYLWSFDDGNYSKEANPNHVFNKPGKYEISLIVRSKIDNSIMSKSNNQLLTVHPKPNVDFNWELNEENGIPFISFNNSTDKANTWNWNFGDGGTSTDKNPNHTYRNKGQYLITLTAKSIEGCENRINKDIFVSEDFNLLAPNSFTPNGDGLNDFFLPTALNRLNGTFTMAIYSQTEGLIYETKNIDQPWDGSNQKMGTKCKEGSYVWVVKLKTEEGKIEQYKGAILLLK